AQSSDGLPTSDEISRLNRVVDEQGREIEALKQQLARIERALLNSAAAPGAAPAPRVVPVSTAVLTTSAPTPAASPQQQAQPQAQLAGFRSSGDFRYRFDGFVRGTSPQAVGVQNLRQRYRLRLNADRDVSSDLGFHMQLSTGAVNNGITFDQDF